MAEYLRRGVMHALLAYRSGELAGMAVYRWQYSTWLGQVFTINEFYIRF
jgi:hypothetical protein